MRHNQVKSHRVERHKCKLTPERIHYCDLTCRIYNSANYIIRQKYSAHRPNDHFAIPGIAEIYNQVRQSPAAIALHHSRICKSTIKECVDDWDTHKKAIRAYNNNPILYNYIKPRPPKKKRKLARVIFDKHTIRKGDYKQGIISVVRDLIEVKSSRKYASVVLVPKRFGCIVEIQYEVEITPPQEEPSITPRWLAIDLGVNILCTLTTNQNLRPVLVNGRIVKSINQWYNKHPGQNTLSIRYFRLENYFHQTSKYIIDYCLCHKIGTIVIGKNAGWKHKIQFDKNRKQHFAYIPYDFLIQKITYKAEAYGIKVILQEESYTSQASALDGDAIHTWDGYHRNYKYSGRRIPGTSYYVTKNGTRIHKDVNGSYNIGRKYMKSLTSDRSLDVTISWIDAVAAARPILVNPLRAAGNLGVAGSTGGRPVERQDILSIAG